MAASLHSEIENGGIGPIDEAINEEMKVLTQEFEAAEFEIAKQHIRAFKPIYEKRKKSFQENPEVLATSTYEAYFCCAIFG